MNADHPYKITMLPAGHGDCFFLEFGHEEEAFRMMIDCGPSDTWGNLKAFLDQLILDHKKIDVLLITHYDGDHIEGALKLLAEPRYSALVGQVWHNGLKEIAPNLPKQADENEETVYQEVIGDHYPAVYSGDDIVDGETEISESQSLNLAMLLDQQNKTVNSMTKGCAITKGASIDPLGPEKDIEVFFLLPEQKALDNLLKAFRTELQKKSLSADASLCDYCQKAFDWLMNDLEEPEHDEKEIGFQNLRVDQIPELSSGSCPPTDTSPTNKASIAIIIRYHGRKFMFPGDAHPTPLIRALKDWANACGEDLHFNIIKLPHHGAKGNCFRLLEKSSLDADVFLISTNGNRYDHPDPESLAKVVRRSSGPQPKRRLIFNYPSDAYVFFSDAGAQKRYNYSAEYRCTISDTEGDADDRNHK